MNKRAQQKRKISTEKVLESNTKNDEKLHFKKIRMLKGLSIKEKNECIVQEGPNLADGHYRRRRSYTKQHKSSWISSLEKSSYVKCMFQNCHFIAMSLEDMISHFGYCNGDSSFAKFKCPMCKGCVTSEDILKKHISRSHNGNIDSKNESLYGSNSDNSKEQDSVGASNQLEKKNHKDISNKNTKEGNTSFELPAKELVVRKRGRPSKKLTSQAEVDEKNGSKVEAENIELQSKQSQKDEKDHEDSNLKKILSDKKDNKSEQTSKEKFVNPKKRRIELMNSDDCGEGEGNKNKSEDITEEKAVKGKKRGRKPKQKPEETDDLETAPVADKADENSVTCGKCKNFSGTRKSFQDHNFKKHVGLGWIDGEDPVDLTDEKEIIKLVRTAFKVTKKGTCEICQDVKRSFMGFVSHIQNCGKSEEEKDALKVQCPYCSAKCLKYSMPVHIKLTHSDNNAASEGNAQEGGSDHSVEPVVSSGKRRSAIKAASKFQEVLKEIDEPETMTRHYVFYEKGNGKFPKMCTQLINCWYKCQREKTKISCRHPGCDVAHDSVSEAKYHHYTCPKLPDAVYMCEACDYYSVQESDLPPHFSAKHSRILKRKKVMEDLNAENESDVDQSGDDESSEDNEDADSNDDQGVGESIAGSKKKKKRRKSNVETDKKRKDADDEMYHKKIFCRRENLETDRKYPFFCNALKITLEDEKNEEQRLDKWSELSTQASDWKSVPTHSLGCLPSLDESISVDVSGSSLNPTKWKRFRRFEGDIIEGVPTFFVGGSIRCMSWCKVSYHRSLIKTTKQYMAVGTAPRMNHLRDIQNQSESIKTSLLQIWDCGVLSNDSSLYKPKLALGIRHESDIWDLAWFPEDTWRESSGPVLTRLGLLATAADDGVIRVWSICDPDHLAPSERIQIYATYPVVKLVTDEDLISSCFRLSIGNHGVIAGGFANGVVAFWNLKSISSPLNEKEGNCTVIRPFLTIQAHKTAIMVLKFCPTNSRYISTGALDRTVKFWDLESPDWPVEQFSKELCLSSVWPRHWPLVICNFDDIMSSPHKGTIKFIRDVFHDKHYSCLLIDDMCLSLSFSDWLNIVGGANNVGDIKLTLLPNFINDLKRNKKIITLSSLRLQPLADEENEDVTVNGKPDKGKKKAVRTPVINNLSYEELHSRFGLVFSEGSSCDKGKSKESKHHFLEFPIRAVNKICFNPNFKSCTHIAAGYNCGLVRIVALKEVQTNGCLQELMRKHEKEPV